MSLKSFLVNLKFILFILLSQCYGSIIYTVNVKKNHVLICKEEMRY